MGMKKSASGKLISYMLWPLLLTGVWLVVDVTLLFVNKKAALIAIIATVLYFAAALVMFILRRKRVLRDYIAFSASYDDVESRLLTELDIPYAVLDGESEVLWCNNAFSLVCGKGVGTNFRDLIPDVKAYTLPKHESDERAYRSRINGKVYKIVMRAQETPEFDAQLKRIARGAKVKLTKTVSAFLYDETELTALRQENYDSRLVFGLLYIDNYDEVLDSYEEVKRSLLTALIDRKITTYMHGIDAVIRKLEKDKYFFIFQNRYLQWLQDDKFSILYDVRSVNIGGPSEVGLTISIGLGVNAKSYEEGYESARAAMDLALGRGGDQAVVRDGEMITYFGGKSESIEKNTRVRARVKAHALKELVESKENVFIMGHANPDVDAIGAAIGVYRIVKHCNKNAYIVLNEVGNAVRPTVSNFINNPEYESTMFISAFRALELAKEDDLLVIVDVNRPSFTECPELYDRIKQVIVLDHHRKTTDSVDDAALSYVEPYASSACELVAEILQYIGEGLRLRPIEAEAMYAGIMIDTNNFLTKTGVRTFEAAAYLRRNGAEVTRIRKAFRSDKKEYMERARAIAGMEMYLNDYAFAECSGEGLESPNVIGAQVANELMEIDGVKASFVFTYFQNQVYISARSIDELNVQLVMEKFGGGGHMTVAGAQLTGVTIAEAKQQVKAVLKQMLQDGTTK
ncbi:MAG: DHH family phosphoesterase [Lachnospiraceae bacterium]|nr:DHH family phosphoesterase [Lachnospiraceae bacterium]